ncbi:MAG: acyl carrier protein [Lachnospiraceae bacterium]|jgi:Phosphopantetheine attachment site.|nr:acyl carrier protein [Lachnospiraceae bacterium]MCI8826208.1 acyl carrier protein [Lachnospiraceae bacterium]MCI9370837.1 acyl carrier protein [Lachnospiraceae bacterium]MDE7307739.1 acyl carrier protein [Lachnospiraceae bacterium]
MDKFNEGIYLELLEILQNLHPDVDFTINKELVDAGILDSFDIVTLVSDIADIFDVTISADEIIPENFNSASALAELIKIKLEDEE